MPLRKGNDTPVTRSPLAPSSSAISKSVRPSTKPKRRPGRPFKMPSRDTSSRSGSEKPSASPSVAPQRLQRRALSMLEALPVELIEQIFFYSLNLNLPRASPALAAALTSERIYGLLILLACWDDPPRGNPIGNAIARILAPWIMFRSSLTSAAVPNLMILTIHRQWINAGVEMEPEERAALDKFMRREDDTVRVFHGHGDPLRKFVELLGNEHPELLRISQAPGPRHYELHISPMTLIEIRSRDMRTAATFPALNLIKFPEKLIRGRKNGFTADDVAYLEMLRMTSNKFTRPRNALLPSTITTVDRVALHEGVATAIRTQNYNAMLSLLKIDEFCFRFNVANQGRGVFYTIPSDHFITVTRVGRENPHLNHAFFEALIRTSAESLPPNSQEIMAWSLDNVRLSQRNPSTYNEINGRFARWLSDFMLRLPEQVGYAMEEPGSQLFCCGQLDILDLEGCRYMDEVLSPWRPPLENWTGQSSFHPEDHWVKKT
ncbi:hypothetical protein N7512_004509 [Penicillium capsulatum]|nr:hypothetical protein N7512_004509 [Penicillium capsulatum]